MFIDIVVERTKYNFNRLLELHQYDGSRGFDRRDFFNFLLAFLLFLKGVWIRFHSAHARPVPIIIYIVAMKSLSYNNFCVYTTPNIRIDIFCMDYEEIFVYTLITIHAQN